MSSVDLEDKAGATYSPDVFTRDEGGKTVVIQAVTNVDPVTGAPNASTEATLLALKGVADGLLVAAQAIEAASEALNAKTVAVNTSAISGTVALDSTSLSLLENVTVGGTVALDTPTVTALTENDATLADVLTEIRTQNDNMTRLLHAMLAKMPRLQANDRLMADLSETSLATITTLTTLNDILRLQSLGTTQAGVSKYTDGIAEQLSIMGAAHLYKNIIRTP